MNITDPQTLANSIRELVGDAEPVRRLGIEVLRATGSEHGLTLRARHVQQVLVAQRGAGWWQAPPDRLAREIAGDLVAGAFGAPAPVRPAPPPTPVPARPARRRVSSV